MIYEPLSAVEIHLYVLNVFISANIDSQIVSRYVHHIGQDALWCLVYIIVCELECFCTSVKIL